MPKGKIISAGNTEVFADLLNSSPVGTSELKVEQKPLKKIKDEKILINFKLNKSIKERLQKYCDENDMTLTAGIKKAIREMLKEEAVE